MPEEITKTPSMLEVNKAESLLKPEQIKGSEARFEILKHEDSLLKAGVSEQQIKQSAELASDTAVSEYRELVAQNPIKSVIEICDLITDSLEGDEKALFESFRTHTANFAPEWRDKIQLWRDMMKARTGREDTFRGLLQSIGGNDAGATPLIRQQEGTDRYAILTLARTLQKRYILGEGIDSSDPEGKALISLSPEGVRTIFKNFGAEVPTIGKEIKSGRNIETKLPGVGITYYSNWGSVSLEFSPAAFEKVVTLPTGEE